MEPVHACAQTMHDADPCRRIVVEYAGTICISAGICVATAVMASRHAWRTDTEVACSGVTVASVYVQVLVYRLPSLPGNAPGESKGYAMSGQPLSAPTNSTVRAPAFGSAASRPRRALSSSMWARLPPRSPTRNSPTSLASHSLCLPGSPLPYNFLCSARI